MRKNTAENKLNALLGLAEKAVEVKTRSTGRIVGISEDEIQEFREAQGLIYFLQAPALFTPKTCKHCGEPFLVSRKYVAYCSYTCIQKSLAEQGVQWKKGQDLETLANDPDVYDGNEPIWIRNPYLSRAQAILNELLNNSETTEPLVTSGPPKKSDPEPTSTPTPDSGNSSPEGEKPPSSSITTTTSSQPTPSTASSKPKSGKRKISFG